MLFGGSRSEEAGRQVARRGRVGHPARSLRRRPVGRLSGDRGNNGIDRTLRAIAAATRGIRHRPIVTRLVHTARHFGSQLNGRFNTTVACFSFLSVVPVLVISFTTKNFILTSRPVLLRSVFSGVLRGVDSPALTTALGGAVGATIRRHAAMKLINLTITLCSNVG